MCDNRKGEKLEILKLEYEQAYQRLLYLDGQANTCIGYIFAAIAGFGALYAFFIGSKELDSFTYLLIAIGAIVVNLLIIFALHHTVQCFRVGGYIKYLEETINEYIEDDILKWETLIAKPEIHHSIPTILLVSIIAMLFIILTVGGGYIAIMYVKTQAGVGLCIGIICTLALEVLSIVIYVYRSLDVHEKIYSKCIAIRR